MSGTKNLIQSRTIWALLVAFALRLAEIWGVEIPFAPEDMQNMIYWSGELIALAIALAGRFVADKKLTVVPR